ncbi:hypothetical protein ASC68_18780 [Devosia sp. Root105]|nr:hypothetical protein ASC68_18780 [Devosia sp. Root105]
MDTPTSESSPIIWGARAIAAAIGKTPRATFHLLERGELPARKVGHQWVADRDALLGFLRCAPIATAA